MIDYMTGTIGVVGLLACLVRAKATGQGCDVDTNLFDVATHQHCYSATWYLNMGFVPTRERRGSHQSLTPVQSVRTADGWIFVMCMKDKFWEALAERISRPDLICDERFSSQAARLQNRDVLTSLLDETMTQRTTGEWLELLAGAVPAAPIYAVNEAFENSFMAETGMVTAIDHPARKELKLLAPPIKVNGERPMQVACPPLGADNERYGVTTRLSRRVAT